MTTFRAYQVTAGDAFQLEYGTKVALVDGGQDPTELDRKLTKSDFDIVICTHNDGDHAVGLNEVLRNRSVRELWVPATWIAAAVDFSDELLLSKFHKEIQDESFDDPDGMEGEEDEVDGAEDAPERLEEVEGRDDVEGTDGLANALRGMKVVLPPASKNARLFQELLGNCRKYLLGELKPRQIAYPISSIHPVLITLLNENPPAVPFGLVVALKDISNILNLIRTALSKNIVIRAFEYRPAIQPKVPIGTHSEWWAHNSVEIKRVVRISKRYISAVMSKRYRSTLISYLCALGQVRGYSLSTVNRHALTFRFDNSADRTCVFFCSDSHLGYSYGAGRRATPRTADIVLPSKCLVTTPHHGSPNNNRAYVRLDTEQHKPPKEYVWVRSDGDTALGHGGWPTEEYIHQKNAPATAASCYCTLCRDRTPTPNGVLRRQNVLLEWNAGVWKPAGGTNPCNCK